MHYAISYTELNKSYTLPQSYLKWNPISAVTTELFEAEQETGLKTEYSLLA